MPPAGATAAPKDVRATGLPSSKVTIPQSAGWDVPSRYQFKKLIGSGSYGFVAEFLDTQTNQVVAIKKVHRVFDDLVDCKRILREIALLNRLSHKHIVKIIDVCPPTKPETFNELYFVLEIADSDLKKLFRTPVYLSELHIQTLLYNLLVGLKYVHSCGILHRDLKPANCLVNQDCTVKICDFGLGRTIDQPAPPLPNSPRDDQEPVSGVPHTQNLARQLTSHVVTRWYRAPELILLQEKYTGAIDTWSVGCIFAEMLNMIKENQPYHSDRAPLFPGSSCFPLSPDQKHKSDYKFHTRGNRDQLNMIFGVLGTPSADDTTFLEKEDARRYISLFPERPPTALKSKFPHSSAEALDLLAQMLAFNPNNRIAVDAALAHPYLAGVRDPKAESSGQRVKLPFNDWQSLTAEQLRFGFMMEVKKHHPDVVVPPCPKGFEYDFDA